MLKLVGLEKEKVVDEKVLIDDNNRPTKFLWFLVLLELLFDAGVFCIIFALLKKKNSKSDCI